MQKLVINYDGTLIRSEYKEKDMASFLQGDLSWAELTSMGTKSKTLAEKMPILDGKTLPETLKYREVAKEFVWDDKLGKLPKSVYLLQLTRVGKSNLEDGISLPDLIADKECSVRDLTKGAPMFDRDQPADFAREELKAYLASLKVDNSVEM